MKRVILRAVSISAMILLLALLIISLDPLKIFGLMSKVNMSFIILILVTNLIAFIFFFLSWHLLIRRITRISLKDSFEATAVSVFVNLVFPSFTLGGEIARIRFLNKKRNIENEKLVAAMSINRFQYGLVLVLFISLGILLLYFYNLEINMLIFSLSIVVSLNFLLFILIIYPNIIKKITNKVFLFFNKFFKKNEDELNKLIIYSYRFIDNFSNNAKELIKSYELFLAMLASVFQWFFNSLVFYFAFLSFGLEINLGIVFLTFPLFAVLTAFSLFLPANIGIVEPIMIAVFSSFSINPLYSAVAVFLVRGLIILEDLFITMPFFLRNKQYITGKLF